MKAKSIYDVQCIYPLNVLNYLFGDTDGGGWVLFQSITMSLEYTLNNFNIIVDINNWTKH